jgi:hypothetical protein
LPSRIYHNHFENKEFTSQEKEQYNKLISWNKEGISSFILDTIKHRDYFTNNTRIYAETGKEMKAALKEQEYQNRVFDNYIVIGYCKMLQDKFNFPLRMINISILLKRPLLKTQKQLQTPMD